MVSQKKRSGKIIILIHRKPCASKLYLPVTVYIEICFYLHRNENIIFSEKLKIKLVVLSNECQSSPVTGRLYALVVI